MFNLEVLIGAAEMSSPAAMKMHRDTLDAGAQTFNAHPRFLREELLPYRVRARVSAGNSATEFRPETEETKKYRILRRYYE